MGNLNMYAGYPRAFYTAYACTFYTAYTCSFNMPHPCALYTTGYYYRKACPGCRHFAC